MLLTGQLKVDSVEVYRMNPTINVTLVGKFLTKDQNNTNALIDFLNENGDITIDEIFDAFQQKMQK